MDRDNLKAEMARRHHLDFMRYMWQRSDPLADGIHVNAVCNRMDRAIEDFRNGKSSYLMIKLPVGHHKSNMASRYLPANFIGKFPECEIIVTGYASGLVHDFSRDCREIMRDSKYQNVYPGVEISKEARSVEEWVLSNGRGKVHWLGMGGSIVGKRGHLIVVDDFFKDRAEAESETVRNSRWNNFAHDIMSRMGKLCIVIVLATPWHVDDIFARIESGMKKNPRFPRFEEIKYPAFSDKYPTGTLYPSGFSRGWYDSMSAVFGTYGTASLLQCEPTVRGGNFLRVDKIVIVDGLYDPNLPEEFRSGPRFGRAWDLASTQKERVKDDPDWTIGVHGAVKLVPTAIRDVNTAMVYVNDVIRGQWEGMKRQKVIQDTAIADGMIPVGIEAFGAYKDAYTEMRDILSGIRSVRKMQLPGDKTAKADPLVPILEAGNLYLKRAPWNEPFIECIANFPNGKHVDDVDALAVLYHMLAKKRVQIF